MLDEVEFVDDLTEKQVAVEDSGLMNKVLAGFDNFFNRKKKSQAFEESKISQASMYNESADKKKEDLRKRMGPEIFSYYYNFLLKKRQDPSTDEAKLRSELNSMIGGNKELKNLMFDLEQVIFREMQNNLMDK